MEMFCFSILMLIAERINNELPKLVKEFVIYKADKMLF